MEELTADDWVDVDVDPRLDVLVDTSWLELELELRLVKAELEVLVVCPRLVEVEVPDKLLEDV